MIFIFVFLPLSPWTILAIWLHLRTLKKLPRNGFITHSEQKFTTCSYEIEIGCVLCYQNAHKFFSSSMQFF
jgi:hypothetical protein